MYYYYLLFCKNRDLCLHSISPWVRDCVNDLLLALFNNFQFSMDWNSRRHWAHVDASRSAYMTGQHTSVGWDSLYITTEEISDSRSDSEEIGDSGSLLARIRRHATFLRMNGRQSKQDFYQAAATTVDNQRRQICLELFWLHSSPQSSRRAFIRPGNYTCISSWLISLRCSLIH